jgi:hypothetical protein
VVVDQVFLLKLDDFDDEIAALVIADVDAAQPRMAAGRGPRGLEPHRRIGSLFAHDPQHVCEGVQAGSQQFVRRGLPLERPFIRGSFTTTTLMDARRCSVPCHRYSIATLAIRLRARPRPPQTGVTRRRSG